MRGQYTEGQLPDDTEGQYTRGQCNIGQCTKGHHTNNQCSSVLHTKFGKFDLMRTGQD